VESAAAASVVDMEIRVEDNWVLEGVTKALAAGVDVRRRRSMEGLNFMVRVCDGVINLVLGW
jgi:hypothetical protein